MMKSVETLCEELDAQRDLLEVPSWEQYGRIVSGREISPDAVLLGVIQAAGFLLSEASLVIGDHTLPNRRGLYLDERVLQGLGHVVEKPARPPGRAKG